MHLHEFGKNRYQAKQMDRLWISLLTRAGGLRTKRLIAVLTPGFQAPCGGVLSIASIYRESSRLKNLHSSRVVLCTVPGDQPLDKYTWFENRNYILDLESLLASYESLDYLLLHIPEYAVNQVLRWLTTTGERLIRNVKQIHVNVMLQNIDLIHDQKIDGLKRFGFVTCTTAHDAYTNSELRAALGVPIHKLGVFRGAEQFSIMPYQKKKPLLIVSHDHHPLKEQVLKQIAEAYPDLRIQVIQSVTYEEFKELARRAKWSLTFGEGLDSYFGYPIFSGGISFAVFNDRFFTKPFAQLENVYPSWEILMDRITSDLSRLDEPRTYHHCWQRAYDLLSVTYNTKRFRENLRLFYQGQYTFP